MCSIFSVPLMSFYCSVFCHRSGGGEHSENASDDRFVITECWKLTRSDYIEPSPKPEWLLPEYRPPTICYNIKLALRRSHKWQISPSLSLRPCPWCKAARVSDIKSLFRTLNCLPKVRMPPGGGLCSGRERRGELRLWFPVSEECQVRLWLRRAHLRQRLWATECSV